MISKEAWLTEIVSGVDKELQRALQQWSYTLSPVDMHETLVLYSRLGPVQGIPLRISKKVSRLAAETALQTLRGTFLDAVGSFKLRGDLIQYTFRDPPPSSEFVSCLFHVDLPKTMQSPRGEFYSAKQGIWVVIVSQEWRLAYNRGEDPDDPPGLKNGPLEDLVEDLTVWMDVHGLTESKYWKK